MSDLIVASGDIVMFEPNFGNRSLIGSLQAVLVGTGRFMINGKPGCVITDLMKVVVPCSYISGAFVTPGAGMIQLVLAAPDQTAKKVLSGGPALIKGGQCQAVFIPTAPAMNPSTTPPTPDPTVGVPTQGKGRFIVTQVKVRAN